MNIWEELRIELGLESCRASKEKHRDDIWINQK